MGAAGQQLPVARDPPSSSSGWRCSSKRPCRGVSAGTVLLFAIGVAMIIGWLFGGSWFAAVPGLLLLALGVSRLVFELNVYQGPGLTALSLAVAFVLIWLIGLARKKRSRWPPSPPASWA